jgi:hypothetical protein
MSRLLIRDVAVLVVPETGECRVDEAQDIHVADGRITAITPTGAAPDEPSGAVGVCGDVAGRRHHVRGPLLPRRSGRGRRRRVRHSRRPRAHLLLVRRPRSHRCRHRHRPRPPRPRSPDHGQPRTPRDVHGLRRRPPSYGGHRAGRGVPHPPARRGDRRPDPVVTRQVRRHADPGARAHRRAGLADHIGVLEPGRQDDIALLDLSGPHNQRCTTPERPWSTPYGRQTS